jgi:hypothetical protein
LKIKQSAVYPSQLAMQQQQQQQSSQQNFYQAPSANKTQVNFPKTTAMKKSHLRQNQQKLAKILQ